MKEVKQIFAHSWYFLFVFVMIETLLIILLPPPLKPVTPKVEKPFVSDSKRFS